MEDKSRGKKHTGYYPPIDSLNRNNGNESRLLRGKQYQKSQILRFIYKESLLCYNLENIKENKICKKVREGRKELSMAELLL